MARVFSFQAMQAGRQSVVAILPTGRGKSLLFQLPAFCSGLGTTIVVVPLIALQHNLHARNRGLNLRSEIWNGQKTPPVDTILLVTPEATGSPAFLAFASRLAAEHRLDRIVIDECHYLLYEPANFRPAFESLSTLPRPKHAFEEETHQQLSPERMESPSHHLRGLEGSSGRPEAECQWHGQG